MFEQRIIVDNLSWHTSEKDIQQLLAKAGNVKRVKIITDNDSGESLGVALVTMSFGTKLHEKLKKLDGAILNGKKINLRKTKPGEPSANQIILAAY